MGEIENVQAEIKGEKVDSQKTRRKKDGIFYTPKYITKYIVENTVGKLCKEKRDELKIVDEEYVKGRKNRKKDIVRTLDKKLDEYRNWLLSLTILVPACGSGAFLNQALEFLITEHRKVDELRAQLLGGAIIFSDITTDILERNIFGVDLNEESVEIAKLSLWLRTAQKGRKLNNNIQQKKDRFINRIKANIEIEKVNNKLDVFYDSDFKTFLAELKKQKIKLSLVQQDEWEEYEIKEGFLKTEQQLENRLLYGFYPEVLNHPGEEKQILKQLVNSYLYRDILAFSDIRKPEIIENLLQALALQIGSEVNYTELSQILEVNKVTIQKYIDILEKGYVVFRLRSYSKNVRNEIKRGRKIYFYDNGVRNLLIGNFNPLNIRQDKGNLWENFLISERKKQNVYKESFVKMYFWRTLQQQEVDYVEEDAGILTGYEFKWKANKSIKLSKTFTETYSANSVIIDRKNFRKFVIRK